MINYRIKPGDTLWKIAKKYPGVTPKIIKAFNSSKIKDINKIQAGWTIKIPKFYKPEKGKVYEGFAPIKNEKGQEWLPPTARKKNYSREREEFINQRLQDYRTRYPDLKYKSDEETYKTGLNRDTRAYVARKLRNSRTSSVKTSKYPQTIKPINKERMRVARIVRRKFSIPASSTSKAFIKKLPVTTKQIIKSIGFKFPKMLTPSYFKVSTKDRSSIVSSLKKIAPHIIYPDYLKSFNTVLDKYRRGYENLSEQERKMFKSFLGKVHSLIK